MGSEMCIRDRHTTVYGYLNATITSILRGDTQFKTEYLLGQVDGRSSRAVLHCGTLVKGDMILFNIDHHGQRALGEVQGFLEASPPLIHVTVFKPCYRTGDRVWDISQPTETIISCRTVIDAVTYMYASDHKVRIIVPPIV